MQPDPTEQLSSIVAALTDYIDLVRSLQLKETAVLLDMAKLDLQMKIHAISDRELQALCEALEHQRAAAGRRRRKPQFARATAALGAARADAAALPPACSANDIVVPPPRLGRSARRVRKVS